MRGLVLLFAIINSLWFTLPAEASSGITYQGRILKPNGDPLEGSNVQFRIQIRTPNNEDCLMYEEAKSIDMRNTRGLFSLTINDGTGSRGDATGWGLDRIFSNRSGFTFDPTTCSIGSTYTPGTHDGRSMVVYFKDETMGTWEPMPRTTINYVPFAINAAQVAGFTPESLLRVIDAGSLGNVSPLSTANYNSLLALIAGTSSQYQQYGKLQGVNLPASFSNGQVLGWSGGAWSAIDPLAGLPTFARTALPTCAAGEFLRENGAGALVCTTPANSGGTVTAVVAGAGLSGGTITTTGTISLPVLGGGGTAVKVTYDTYGRITSAGSLAEADIPTLTTAGKVSGGAINSGTIGGSASINTSGNLATSGLVSAGSISTTGGITANDVTASTMSANTLRVFETTNNFKVSIVAPSSLSSDYQLQLPMTAGGAGQVLTTDGAGNLSWQPTGVTGITSLTGDVTASGTGAVSATLSNTGVTSGTYGSSSSVPTFTVDSKGRLTAAGSVTISGTAPGGTAGGDLGGTYPNPSVDRIRGMNVNAGTLGPADAGKVFVWQGTEYQSQWFGVHSLKSSTGVNQFASATCTSSQTLTWSALTDTFTCVDIAGLNASVITSGTLSASVLPVVPVAKGGTNSPTALFNNRIMITSGGAVVEAPALLDGQLLIGQTGGAPIPGTLTAGSGISITNAAGSITITATGGGGDFYRSGSASMTGQFLSVSGSSASPGMAFSHDTDTGMFSPGANTLAFATAGQNRLTINEQGFVGIGETNPTVGLHVGGSATVNGHLYASSFTSPFVPSYRVGVSGTGATAGHWTRIMTLNMSQQFMVYNTKIEVVSGNTSARGANASIYLKVKQQAALGGAPSINLELDSSSSTLDLDDVVAVTTVNSPALTTVELYLRMNMTWDSFTYTPLAANGWYDTVDYTSGALAPALPGGTQTAAVAGQSLWYLGTVANSIAYTDGNVGIGTAAPSNRLSVFGGAIAAGSTGSGAANGGQVRFYDIGISGSNYVAFRAPDQIPTNVSWTLPSSDGSANQVLSTNGSGSLTWASGLTNSLNSAYLFVGNGSNVATAVLMSGDATLSNAGTLTIANDAVTFAKLQNVNTNRILGRSTAGSGDIEEIRLGDGVTLSQGTLGLVVGGGLAVTNGTLTTTGVGDFLRSGTASMTGQLQAIGGSSLAPGYTFGGDTTTGMYRAGAGSLSFATNGQQRMTIAANGNVGIGTTNSNRTLAVQGDISATNLHISDSLHFPFLSAIGGYAMSGESSNHTGITSQSGLNIVLWPQGAGQVGVGVVNPNAGTKMQVNGVIAAGSIGSGAGNGGQVRFYDLGDSGNNYVAFRAPDALTADVTWTLPSSDSAGSGYALVSNGAGSLGWQSLGGGGDFFRSGSASMTGNLLAAHGSSLTPGISFSHDTDTGMYSSGVNTLGFSTAGQERMRITSAGNVETERGLFGGASGQTDGIRLSGDVSGSQGNLGLRFALTTNQGGRNGYVRMARTAGDTFHGLEIGTETTHPIRFMTNGTADTTERMRITPGGTVGIGTTTPNAGAIFQANGGAIAAGTTGSGAGNGGQVRFYETAAGTNYVAFRAPDSIAADVSWTLPTVDGTAGQVLRTNGAGSLSWFSAGVGAGDFMKDGSVSMTGQFLSTSGSSLSPGLSFSGDTNTGIYRSAADEISFATTGEQRMVINSIGKVGIGTTSPTQAMFTVYSPFNDSSVVHIGTPGTQGNQVAQLELASKSDGGVVGTSANNKGWQIFARGDSFPWGEANDFGLSFWSGTGWLDALRIDSVTGMIGAGTTTPVMKLDVAGGLKIGATTITCSATTAGSVRVNAGALEYCTNSAWTQVGLQGTVTTVTAGSATAPGLAFAGDLNTGVFSPAADTFSITAGGAEGLRVNTIASSANYVSIYPAGTLTSPIIAGTGTDTNVDLTLQTKGTGGVVAKGSIRSVDPSTGSALVTAGTTIDWSKGNNQGMSVACTATTFTNMQDGATYNLAVTETGITTCVFTHAGLNFYYAPGNGPRVNGQPTMYSFTRIGNNVFTSWSTMAP